MNPSERINALIAYSNMSVKALSERIGVKTPQTLYELQKGKTKTISESVQYGILNAFPEINKMWLITGEGEMLSSEEHPITTETETVPKVPLYNLDARGGFDDNVEMSPEHIERMIPWAGARPRDFALEVTGTSMMPNITPGSYVLLRFVEGWREFIETHILYVIELVDGRRLLKEIRQSDKGDGYISLVSYNPDVPVQSIRLSIIERVYKVVGIMTKIGF